VALAGLTLLIGFGAQPVLNFAIETAGQLLNPDVYIRAVFGG
jgi:formate hydrogenlyase subunit 3/multisubunit Na+/H+ antiporter MnhD subunit